MKKFLLSFFMILAVSSMAFAEKTITEDFTSNPDATGTETGWLPTDDYVADLTSYTSPTTGLVWKISNVKYSTYGGSYIIVKAPGEVVFPAFDFDVATISILTGATISASAKVALYVGETKIEEKSVNEKSTVFTWTIPVKYQKAGTIYTLKSVSKNAQYQNIVITEATTGPAVSFKEKNTSAFASVKGSTHEQEEEVLSAYLTTDITVSVEGVDAELFTLSTNTLPKDGGSIKVTYNGTTEGAAEATLKIVSGTVSAEKDLTGFTASHVGTEEDPLTIADVINMNSANKINAWVTGVIANGCAVNVDSKNVNGITSTITNSSIVLCKTAEATPENLPVQLPAGDVRTALNIKDNSSLIGTTVKLYGSLENYYARPGVKDVSDYKSDASTGVEETLADENAPVEYFNLQGVKVANPENGIFIKRQGSRASKVVL